MICSVQNTPKLKETVSVANNACWAIGELAVKVCKALDGAASSC